ncbi:hypothetical protein JZ751_021941 [Albula glossodonta]|uniref:Uncharacterized protein n=1 Tax=Albula glossodonta TaxID=121402 RepID=A0A8T2N2P9_9TELE|nr:hypothetical protein JZ751_021941 [Albula glossodonta]
MSRNERVKRWLRDTMTELDGESGKVKLPVELRGSYDLKPPHMNEGTVSSYSSSQDIWSDDTERALWRRNSIGGPSVSSYSSSEDIWSEDYSRTYHTVTTWLSHKAGGMVSRSSSIRSAATTGKDSGFSSTAGSPKCQPTSEARAESSTAFSYKTEKIS